VLYKYFFGFKSKVIDSFKSPKILIINELGLIINI
jgi:hypothetical protein